MSKPLCLGVLVSGQGTNLQAIIDACERKEINAYVGVVISNKPNAYALQRAKKHGIPNYVILRKDYPSQLEYEKAMVEILKAHEVELVVLAGFMKILSSYFIECFRNRIINIHPSLIPAFCGKGFYGMKVHEAVIEYGVKVTGATVHFVDENVDAGPIILQEPVFVDQNDTPETLAQKVHEVEHKLLVKAIKLLSENKVEIVGRRVIIKEGE
ncbi:phosphoribosylglycinamide formyltransferase [Pseudothermotoga thermarum]|uniref:Phosphoribosylglycinamide formyltransferase n=1 Tax=Pseudothermotoga thermarum DSM 5069 TaxID=688269 RepID=F7YWW2_9THEM|nr:phosphoribosylglycinamide formyltransferase [Pseudothermotoga thermarum]AEH50554.1 formyltetrahydrofolate-dependent phosphoribosylglycinamide formyltransferase [Pseudothermotoga thermarum DSM 5069]